MSPECRNRSAEATRGENDADQYRSVGLARSVLLFARSLGASVAAPGVRPQTTGGRHAVPERLPWERGREGLLRRPLQLLTPTNLALLLFCNAQKICYARLRCRIPQRTVKQTS